MKFIVLVLFCAIAYVSAQAELEPEDTMDYVPSRFRRQNDPHRGTITVQGTQVGKNRPSLDIDYKHRIYDKNGMTGNAYGGVNIRPGEPSRQHAGFDFGKEYKNGFIRGQGEVQRGPGGRLSPFVGVKGGFRF
ncbi:hymenoptaecin [Apis florea]|uniref:hymenoptaecin n=1 Tax=Apis florea TaxID=7463 RepID=UPI000252A9D0|nr:hymenoptaecin [Apis florea]XP_012351130.1 hymenoptaecin [Apis florea]XP_012351135.1 hymenoptaecin [Apis florea]